MTSTRDPWALRLAFSVDAQNFIYLRAENTPVRIHCDWQRRGYELVCACPAPSQLFFLTDLHLTGLSGVQCVEDLPNGQTVGLRAKLFTPLASAPPEVFAQELSLLRFGKPRAFPRAVLEWLCEDHWDPLAVEIALADVEERVAASVAAIGRALSPEVLPQRSIFTSGRRAERAYRRSVDECVAEQSFTITKP